MINILRLFSNFQVSLVLRSHDQFPLKFLIILESSGKIISKSISNTFLDVFALFVVSKSLASGFGETIFHFTQRKFLKKKKLGNKLRVSGY